jgi:hypothetical protein
MLIQSTLIDIIIYYTSVLSVMEGTEVFKNGTESSDHHLYFYLPKCQVQ